MQRERLPGMQIITSLYRHLPVPWSAVARTPGGNKVLEQLATLTTGYTPDPEQEQQESTYYDYPVLKQPIWRWEIVWYFFFGGLAAGCYVIASIAALFGSQEDRAVTRAGYYLSLLALLPCPPLLIKDLGRPERFLNMLRMFKVKSPMSMGVWGLVTFSMFSGITAVIQAARDGLLGRWWGARLLAALPQKLLAIPGIFSGLFLGGYTGVLLTATSVPLWSRSKALGAIFLSSALSTGAALISLVLRLTGAPHKSLHKLERLEWGAMLLEIIELLSFLRGSGRVARPLVGNGPNEQGHIFWRFMFGGGLVLPWLLQTLSFVGRGSTKKGRRNGGKGLLIPLLALIGGYFLRRTMIDAGHVSSADARTTLWNARR
ncbi:polysulfide reductase [Ktedonosporobacter rubrisoli]|uniref:Polysulfide reductase n=1 Tax=Ktedonosporobacter rubrisoli TaxID=2509675 RepID=A0A4P6K1M3_KTERU|nr:NrfD/PsrC family molybdoenzyme membrane anchor subunit [Ktedonosporobacter rubrisoli]QBD82078.1 polysulfide reductase [Ktedonosporobacter rubrisoli]